MNIMRLGELILENGKVVETNTMTVDVDRLDSEDPIAYAYGYHRGKMGDGYPKDIEGLAPEFLRGLKESILGHPLKYKSE
jgi:hypothetical protein